MSQKLNQKTKKESPAPAMIVAQDIYKNFPVGKRITRVLKGIDLEVKQGELLMVVGPSGSGKSTLMHTLMGLEKPTRGTVMFKGRRLASMSQDELIEIRRHEIGIVYQQSNWIRALKVIGNVAFPLLLKGVPKQQAYHKAKEMLSLVGLEKWTHLYPNELSSGQQQRAAVARAMITQPDVIIADEPTGNLDYVTGMRLMELLRNLVEKEGKTVVMVTHDLANIDFADRIVRFSDGRIVDIISPTQKTVDKIRRKLIETEPADTHMDQLESDKSDNLALGSGTKQLRWDWQFLHYNIRHGVVKSYIQNIYNMLTDSIGSFLLVIVSVLYRAVYFVLNRHKFRSLNYLKHKISRAYSWFCNALGTTAQNSIRHDYLLDIALKNLVLRRSRSIITIGGVAVGIGFTVFLISLGFGLERIVVEGIANLDQLRQIEVFAPANVALKLNDSTQRKFDDLNQVEKTFPVAGLAGKVSYQAGNSDVVVYGVQGDFLRNTDIIITEGELFTNNRLQLPTQIPANPVTDADIFVGPINPYANVKQLSAQEVETELGQEIDEQGERYVAVSIAEYATRQLVVNNAFLELLGISKSSAIGTKVDLSLVATEEVIDSDLELQSYPEKYEIIGVIGNFDIPTAYVPMQDAKALGIEYYSQFRIISESEERVPLVRSQIETLGYRTTSILDTINQVESLFDTVRGIFALIGLVALGVASFGMFNTLTVSLLERTREVGLMKALGMGTKQIRDLFLTESITMGTFGGLLGILLGITSGFLISLLLSLVAINRGFEFINVTYLPVFTALGIATLSAFTGLITGFYPALRATRISALDALRYE